MKARMTLLAVCLAASCTQAAHAQGGPTEETQASPEAPHARVWDRREMMTQLEIGYRGSFVTNAGYNPFSTNDYLPQFSLAASQTVFAWHRFAFAAGIAWDFANTGATARGDTSSLTMHRLTAPLEGRTHFGDWGYLFLRVAPGTAVVNAEIDDPSAPAPLAKNRWLFATDVSAGYAWLIAPGGRAWRRVPRLWVQTDAGYGWMASDRLNLAPASAGASGVDLGSLALSGAFFRIAAAASF